jgi:hypothetical protein
MLDLRHQSSLDSAQMLDVQQPFAPLSHSQSGREESHHPDSHGKLHHAAHIAGTRADLRRTTRRVVRRSLYHLDGTSHLDSPRTATQAASAHSSGHDLVDAA